MSAEWLLTFTEALCYTGSNSSEILTYVGSTPNYVTQGTTVSILSESGGVLVLRHSMFNGAYNEDVTVNTDDWVVRNANGSAAASVVLGADFAAGMWARKEGFGAMTDALGVGYFAALLAGASVNVDVTLSPTFADTNYTVAGPLVLTSLTVASVVTVQSVTKLSGTVCRVNVKNNGLVSIGGVVIVGATRQN